MIKCSNETYEGCWKQQTISWKSADCCKKFPFYSSTFSNISQKSLDAWLQLGRSLLCFSGRGDDDVTWDGHQPGTRLGYVSVRECNERPTLTDEEFLHVIKPLRRSPHQHPARHAWKPCLTMFRMERTREETAIAFFLLYGATNRRLLFSEYCNVHSIHRQP